jgi:hypothetical protein
MEDTSRGTGGREAKFNVVCQGADGKTLYFCGTTGMGRFAKWRKPRAMALTFTEEQAQRVSKAWGAAFQPAPAVSK